MCGGGLRGFRGLRPAVQLSADPYARRRLAALGCVAVAALLAGILVGAGGDDGERVAAGGRARSARPGPRRG